MNEFLQDTISKLRSKDFIALTIVLGNESCDLDSSVSSLVYACFLYWQYNKMKCKLCTRKYRDEVTYKDNIFVPMLNVNREDYKLKTEVSFCLNEHCIDDANLVFRDDYDINELISSHKTNVVLVDHHVLSQNDIFLQEYVTEVIDHRPLDKCQWKFKADTRSTVQVVGSCTTLVCVRMRSLASYTTGIEEFFKMYPICAELLHSTIVLDTINFSEEASKATPLDEEIVLLLEKLLEVDDFPTFRNTKFAKLLDARKDISSLNAGQLLRKDVKVIGTILAPSLPISVAEFFQMSNVESAMDEALQKTNCDIIVLLGIKINAPSVTRDLAVYSTEKFVKDAIELATLLETWHHPVLNLARSDTNIRNCTYYQQINVSASRKQVVPILNKYLIDFKK